MSRKDSEMGSDNENYRKWLGHVYAYLHASLGGNIDQSGSGRRFGDAYFTHSMVNATGDVHFTVSKPAHPIRPATGAGPFEWRSIQAQKAAEKILQAYNLLD